MALQFITGNRINEPLAKILSPDAGINKEGLTAYNEMINGMKCDKLQFEEGTVVAFADWEKGLKHLIDGTCETLNLKMLPCNFGSDEGRKNATLQLNKFARDKTAGLIGEIARADKFSDETNLVVASLMYMDAQWVTPFDPQKTREWDFHVHGGDVKTVDMMQQFDITAPLNDNPGDGFEYLLTREFVSGGGPLTMLYALPKEGQSTAKFNANYQNLLMDLEEKGLQGMGMTVQKISLFAVPKFDLKQTRPVELPGVQDLLRNELGDIDISQTVRLIHNEKGVEAAAATMSCQADGRSPHAKEIILDRSFLALVIAPDSSVLFAANIADPSQIPSS
jgi:serine protease inhibitor